MPWTIGRPMPLTSAQEARRHRPRRHSVASYFTSPAEPLFEMVTPPGLTAAQAIAEDYRERKARQDALESEQNAARDFVVQVWRDAEARSTAVECDPIDARLSSGTPTPTVLGHRYSAASQEATEGRESDDETAVSNRTTIRDDGLDAMSAGESSVGWSTSAAVQERMLPFNFPPPPSEEKTLREKSQTLVSPCPPSRHPSVRFHRFSAGPFKIARRQAIIMSLPQDGYEGLKYQCARDGCGQVLSTLRSLTYHLHLHNTGGDVLSEIGAKAYPCTDCQQYFQCRRDLMVHRCPRVIEISEPTPTVSERPTPSAFTKLTSSMASYLRKVAQPAGAKKHV